MTVNTSPYVSLGISKNAKLDEIKKAYRTLALEFHPDKTRNNGLDPKNSEEKFKEINLAYELLSDPIKRKNYDLYGWSGVNPARNKYNTYEHPFHSASNPWDIFNEFFNLKNNYQSYSKSQDSSYNDTNSFDDPFRNISEDDLDIVAEIVVTSKEAFYGKEISIQPNELNPSIKFKIPEKSKNKSKFIIRNFGMHYGKEKGDLILILKISD